MTKRAADQAIMITERIVAASDGQGTGGDWDEQALFAALDTCACRAARELPSGSTGQGSERIWTLRRKVIRDHIVQQNLGLVYSMLGRFHASSADWHDMRGEAFLALVRAVDGFDPCRGSRFSTYACNAIINAFIQEARRTDRYQRRFRPGYEDYRWRRKRVNAWSELRLDRLHFVLQRNSACLSDQESAVLAWRFPLNGACAQTLAEVGRLLGLSTERVRQIQNRGLDRIRSVLEADMASIDAADGRGSSPIPCEDTSRDVA